MNISIEELRRHVDYCQSTGAITNRRSGKYRTKGMKVPTIKDRDGYLKISVRGVSLKAHRVAWAMVHGEWPKDQIDHINGQRDDNRIANLREAGHAENAQNQATPRNNTSGYIGVSWRPGKGKWRAQISVGGVRHHLGLFDTAEAASRAYEVAKAQMHPFQPVQRRSV